MKFLIAASILCLALVGQIQGGSLRGLTVPIPHKTYGPPLIENEVHVEETLPIVDEKDTAVIEVEKPEEHVVPVPSGEYGAPAVPTVETVPFIDSLPLVDSVVNFGIPSNEYLPPKPIEIVPTTPKPELPYLKPGLPALPEAPVVPIEEPVILNEVSNAYLPPVEEKAPLPELPIFEPSPIYGPPPTVEIPKIPEIPEVPVTLPTPIVEEVKQGYDYTPPEIAFELPKVTIHAPELPLLTEEIKPQTVYGPPIVERRPTVSQVHIAQVHVAPSTHVLVQPEVRVVPIRAPTKEIPTPLLHGLVSHSDFTENHASTSLSSSLHVNKYVVPSRISGDAVIIDDFKSVAPGFTIHSISGNSERTSVGSFNKVSVVNHELPSFGAYTGPWK